MKRRRMRMSTGARMIGTPITQVTMRTWRKMGSIMIPSKSRGYLWGKNYSLSNSYLGWMRGWRKLSRSLRELRNKENKDSIIVPYRKKRGDRSLGLVLKIHLTCPKWVMLTLQLMIEAYPLL
jgi:hypothetical protein